MNKPKTILSLLLFVLLTLTACSPSSSPSGIPITTPTSSNLAVQGPPTASIEGSSNRVVIKVADLGDIHVELYPETAPLTVANFQKLVAEGFYDGLSFHRAVPGFMIQGGDPNGDGSGGPGYTIKGEFLSNGIENTLKHELGVLSMARNSISKDSAGSQFFIMLGSAPHLDGEYAAFGKVTAGLEVVEAVAAQPLEGERLSPAISITEITFE